MTIFEIIGLIMGGCVPIILLIAIFGHTNGDKLTDHQLYGMDGDEYTRKMMGDDYDKYMKTTSNKKK